jgi:hypothetical protein
MIRFIDDFGCADTNTICRLFFTETSIRRCRDRLQILTEQHHLNRIRGSVNTNYIYFIGKQPQQMQHGLTRANFYTRMKASYDLKTFVPEYQFEKIRSDAYMEFNLFNIRYAAFVEVQLSSGNMQEKYDSLYLKSDWKNHWLSFPLVIIVTNRKQNIKPSKVKYIVLDAEKMSMDTIRNTLYANAIQRETQIRRAANGL